MGHLLVIRSDPCAERRKLVEPFTSRRCAARAPRSLVHLSANLERPICGPAALSKRRPVAPGAWPAYGRINFRFV